MTEGAVESSIAAYGIGAKLRRLRLRKKISLADLGKHTGLSSSMLSQLENGRLLPTLPTLTRIAMVFDVGLEHFFVDDKRRPFAIVRASERLRFPEKPGKPDPAYFFECLDFTAQAKALQAYFAEFPANGVYSDDHVHEGSEFVFVMRGRVAIRAAGEECLVEAGDGVFFDSAEPHAYRGAAAGPAAAIVVTTARRA
jgi:transcriptional regulator with XRE-family HTH domain